MTHDLLDIPDFLKRKTPAQPTRRTARKKEAWGTGVSEKRPIKAQIKALAKRDWTAQQVMRLSRADAATIIGLGVGPEARFVKDKKTQFPDKTEE